MHQNEELPRIDCSTGTLVTSSLLLSCISRLPKVGNWLEKPEGVSSKTCWKRVIILLNSVLCTYFLPLSRWPFTAYWKIFPGESIGMYSSSRAAKKKEKISAKFT